MKTEIQIPVSELKPALQGLGKIVGKSRTLPVLGCIKVSLDENCQTITLQAHNLDEVASVRFANGGKAVPGQLLVPMETLSSIAKRCSNDQFIRLIGSKSDTKIQYSIAGSQAERPVDHVPVSEWPAVKVIDQSPTDLDETFKLTLKQALDCASQDSSRYVLNGACLDTRSKEAHYIVGTDGRHLFAANSFLFGLPESLIIPSHKFPCWTGFMNDGQWRIRMAPRVKAPAGSKSADEAPWFQIDSDHWSYVARAVDGEFPNWKQVVPPVNGKWTKVIILEPGLEAALEALPLLPGGDLSNEPVRLEITNQSLTLCAKGKDQDKDIRVSIPGATVTGHSVETTVNRSYLAKAFRFGLNTIQLEDSLSPLVFSKEGKSMVVMPVRMEGPDVQRKNSPSPQENAPAATPSAAQATNQTETKPERSETVNATTAARPAIQTNGSNSGPEDSRPGFKTALEHLDRIRSKLKDIMADVGEAGSLLKAAEKEQKANQKDIDSVRAKLRELQSVEI
jgi:DNA polymerase III sliding clamp (beta) subunit (PCNA family)